MHDLACHLGMPVGVLARTMTEAEFGAWQRYAARRMLPQRRLELMLARLALVIRQVHGDSRSVLSDFLFDPIDDDEPTDEEPTAQEEAEFFDFKPIN